MKRRILEELGFIALLVALGLIGWFVTDAGAILTSLVP